MVKSMHRCPKCGTTYEAEYQFCPLDGTILSRGSTSSATHGKVRKRAGLQASIPIKTLMVGLGLLALAALLSFLGAFFYLNLKPKYGGLVVKTTPAEATIFVDGGPRGVSPLTLGELRAGIHQIKAQKAGYQEHVQQVEVVPYASENLHWELTPLVVTLTNEQLAEIESLEKKLEVSLKEGILLPPPDDYNSLLFANSILSIDPANERALDAKKDIEARLRRLADVAYAKEDWLEAEKQYKNLALLFPDDIGINERLVDIGMKIDESLKDRNQQIASWKEKAEAALQQGRLHPPDEDNALDAIRTIRRLDRRNPYARTAMIRLKEMLQTRGDIKISNEDWKGARAEFRMVLRYFPNDEYSEARLKMVEERLSRTRVAEEAKRQRKLQVEKNRQQIASVRTGAKKAYDSRAYEKAIAAWREYLRMVPEGDPESNEAYFYLGASYLDMKQWNQAILNFEKCIALNPGHKLAHFNLGILYDQKRDDLARAAEHLRSVEELGGVGGYSPKRIQSILKEIEERRRLRKLEQNPFPVEHKHTFSSCRGSLLFRGGSFEYRTAEADHSFHLELNSLRDFRIEGDQIQVRTRNNKKYNFKLLIHGDGRRVNQITANYLQ